MTLILAACFFHVLTCYSQQCIRHSLCPPAQMLCWVREEKHRGEKLFLCARTHRCFMWYRCGGKTRRELGLGINLHRLQGFSEGKVELLCTLYK